MQSAGFRALPTYAVIQPVHGILTMAKEGNMAPGLTSGLDRQLHVEQYTEVNLPLPPKAKLRHETTVKKIYDKGFVVVLWSLCVNRTVPGWTVSPVIQASYARELANLVNRLGEDHFALGNDIEGVGPNLAVNSYAHVRAVISALEEARLGDAVIEKVAYANYARVLKEALKA
jgi:hypothetical protein